MLDPYVALAKQHGGSDVHLEAGMPPAVRVRGKLQAVGEPVSGESLLAVAKWVVGTDDWSEFVRRRSFDGTRQILGVHCRIHVLASSRGVGLAVRLLAGFQPTLNNLNLHPDLAQLVGHEHGLVLVCGPTGSGKTTTLAALIHEVNLGPARHVVTLENPIEYPIRPRKAFVRQREVGRDTPTFEQGLLDAMREDPDVLMVGEMRRRETMQLTLDAAETGHLVLATLHSSSAAEALQRIVSAFPPESQAAVRAQLADSLLAVLAQRLVYRPEAGRRVPECELLVGTAAVRNLVREGHFFKVASAMETGGADGMWTLERYRRWLAAKRQWRRPEDDVTPAAPAAEPAAVKLPRAAPSRRPSSSAVPADGRGAAVPEGDLAEAPAVAGEPVADGVHVIGDEDVGDLDRLLDEL